jgi:uncharacterized protein YciI
MKYVMTYVSPPDLDMEKVGAHFEAHRALWAEFLEQGTLLAIGPFEDPRDGAMGVFTTQEAAEDFVSRDPFVLNGLVESWQVTGWNEVLLEPV